MSPETTLDLLGIAPADRADCLLLMEAPLTPAAATVFHYLTDQLGSAHGVELGAGEPPATELDWLSAMLAFVPTLVDWHAGRNIPPAVSRATLADFGRNMAINRRVHHRFGMDTYPWLKHVFAGRLYQLGRLQYLIHQPTAAIPGVSPDEWILGIHIPEGGGLGVAEVHDSLALAHPFFAEHFPEQPVSTANCESWLLDPYLSERLQPGTNIAAFAAMFTPYGAPRDEPTDAVYFTFRTRSMAGLNLLPRTTALQRVVLERIEAGGTWQLGFGFLTLPR